MKQRCLSLHSHLLTRDEYSDRMKFFAKAVTSFYKTLCFLVLGINSWVQKAGLQYACMVHLAVAYLTMLKWKCFIFKLSCHWFAQELFKCGLNLQRKEIKTNSVLWLMFYYAADVMNSFLQLFWTVLSLLLFYIEEMHSYVKQICYSVWEIKAMRQETEVHTETWIWSAGKMKAICCASCCASYC